MVRFASLAFNVIEGVQASIWLNNQVKKGKRAQRIDVQSWYGGASFWDRDKTPNPLENKRPTGYIEVEILKDTL